MYSHSPIAAKHSSRIAGLGISTIMQVEAAACRLRHSGHSVIALSVGEPDFPVEERIAAATHDALVRGETRYTATDGTPALKAAIADASASYLGYRPKHDSIVCSAGAKQAIANAMLATLDPGDEVLIPIPSWTSYFGIVQLAGGVVTPIETLHKHGFRINAELLERSITPRAKWLILNSPSNPTGKVLSKDELWEIAEVLRAYPHVKVLCDDIYHQLVFGDQPFFSLCAVAPDLKDRILTVNGVAKTYAMPGFRIGWAIGAADLIRAMTVVQSHTTSCPNSIGQAAAIEALTGPQDAVARARAVYRERSHLVCSLLSASPLIQVFKPGGGLFVWAKYDANRDRARSSLRAKSDLDIALHFLENGVAVVPGGAFGSPGFLRISLTTSLDDLAEGCKRICHAAEVIE